MVVSEFQNTQENYSSSEKYMALMHGAFHYMFVDAGATNELVIKHLVLGLPMNTFTTNREALKAQAIGEHILPLPALRGFFAMDASAIFQSATVKMPSNRTDPLNGPCSDASHSGTPLNRAPFAVMSSPTRPFPRVITCTRRPSW
jgi:hypothetical protein